MNRTKGAFDYGMGTGSSHKKVVRKNHSVVDGTSGEVKFTTKDMRKGDKETKGNYVKRKEALMGATEKMAAKTRGTGEGMDTDALNAMQTGGNLLQRHKSSNKKSAYDKALVGNQKNLPEHLKAKIEKA